MPTQAESQAAQNGPEALRSKLINAARDGWIERLIDLSRRNNLLYYRSIQSSTIDIPNHCVGLYDLLVGKVVPAQSLLPDSLDRPSRILNIARKALENLEEKGLQTLYLGVGFATWKAEDSGRDPMAPIFMVPVSFKRKGRDLSSVEVQVIGEPQVNPVLLHVLDNQFSVTVTEEDLAVLDPGDDADEDMAAPLVPYPEDDENTNEADQSHPLERYGPAFAQLCDLASNVPEFKILHAAVIGNFAFAKLAMVNDLKEAASLLSNNEMIAAIAGDDQARAKIGSSQIEVNPRTLDSASPDQEFCVVDADSSQQCAINGIAAGQSAVVHGPPGTGKSQTITNLIATLIANGKTVLFVAEKRAALEVVQKRLAAARLDHLAMDLHGAELSSKKVMERIARTLATVRSAAQPQTADLHRHFVDRRFKLNTHDIRMHKVSERSGRSVYDMQGALLRLPAEASSSVRWRGQELAAITPLKAEAIKDLLREAGGFAALLTRTDPSPWTGIGFKDGQTVQQAIDSSQRLAHENLPTLKRSLEDVARSTGFPQPQTLAEASETLGFLKLIQEQFGLYRPEIFTIDLGLLRCQLEKSRAGTFKAFWLSLTDSDFKAALKRMKDLRNGLKASPLQIDGELGTIAAIKDKWRTLSRGTSFPMGYAELAALEIAYTETVRTALTLQRVVGESNWEGTTLDELEVRTYKFAADSVTPYRLLQLTEIESKLHDAGVRRLLKDIQNRRPSESVWSAMFEHSWLNSALDGVAAREPEVKGFVGATHNSYVDDFKRLDGDRLKASVERIRRIHAERTIAAMNAHPEQEALIKQEAARSRKHKPLRVIFRDAGEVLTAVCPCWMASPLSVSQLLDRGANFDYVIFDEASQVLPEDAIPAIMRGKHVIVAGDNQQLPPTGFFSASFDDEDEEEATSAVDYESLLDMMLPFAKSFHLNWHYRSRDESLIAFSNHNMYNNRLVTFPGPGGPPAVTHILVDHIPETDGQEDSSSEEVKRVIQLVIRHAQETPGRTLGVITMGIKHANRLQGAMDIAAKGHPELAEFFDTERPERFFIKNLERVQGDERDSIIMSVGYGKDRGGNLPLRFGPILSAGGRRRLNVAVTRARETMTVVSSFAHTDIDASKVKVDTGLEFLRNYLQYASSNGRIFAHGDVTDEPMNDFEADIYEALSARGIKLVPQVGCSQFRIDFGACHPSEPGRFVLAIECDGATYHSSYTARDRDRLRQQQLQNLGWRFHRIWSTDWFLHRYEEVERAWSAYQAAIVHSDEKRDLSKLPPIESIAGPSDEFVGVSDLSGPRSSIFPPIQKRSSIGDYTRSEMKALYDWVASDGKLRTHDELADEMFVALPFTRRGARIEAALKETIRRCAVPVRQ